MNLRIVAGVWLLAGVFGCSKANEAPPIPPPAPAELTTPAPADEEEDGFGDEEDDGELEDDGGFGGGGSAAVTKPPPRWAKDAASKIISASKGKTRAWDRLAVMADRFGHRLSGSKALEDAIGWTLETMKADGLANVHKEKVMVPHWVRGKESLKVTVPTQRELTVLGLGMSVGTKGTLRGEVVVVDHVDAIAKQPKGSLRGKIVLINQAMPPFDPKTGDTHYGPTVQARTRGASEAAKQGAAAVLVRSVTAHSLDNPHTGSLSYEEGVAKIPAAAVTVEGAQFIARAAARGPVKLALKMGAKMLPDAPSGNAIAEIVGREKPEEVVVIGGHIDSWDVGDGSSDDGAGCMMAMEAAALLKELDLTPRRTIRVVLFTNEENGLRGAEAYFEAHGSETHVGAIEGDSGAGAPTGFSMAGDDAGALARLQAWTEIFRGLGDLKFTQGWGGADISPLTKAGVLSMAIRPDHSHYFDLHHSPADTIDKIDPDHLQRNAAALAVLAYVLAERE